GNALDQGEIVDTNLPRTVSGRDYMNVVRTRDTTALEPNGLENKYYAPGIGVVKGQEFDHQSGEVIGTDRLVSLTLNGKPVKTAVSPTGFTGINPTGKATGPARFRGEANIDAT